MSVIMDLIQYDEVKEKLDAQISKLDTIISKLDSVLASIGAPEPTFSATVLASSVAANKHHLVLVNNSTRLVKVRAVCLGAELTGTVTGFNMGYRLQRVSGISGGTTVTIVPFDPTDTLPSGISALANPTVTTVEATYYGIVLNPEETGGTNFVEIDFSKRGIKNIVIPSGKALSIQQYATAGVGTLTATIIFTVV